MSGKALALVDEPKPSLRVIESEKSRTLRAPSARAAFVAKLREYADRIESGEMRGVRTQWRDGLNHIESVELVEPNVSLLRYEWEEG
jgi:hypothetical protein